MTREQYLMYKKSGHSDYLYEYYKENFQNAKNAIFLSAEEFFKYFQFWPESMPVFQIITAFYDAKFNIVRITDKLGNVITFI